MNHIIVKLIALAGILGGMALEASAQSPPGNPSRLRYLLTGSPYKEQNFVTCYKCGRLKNGVDCQCYVQPDRLSLTRNADFLFNSGVYGNQEDVPVEQYRRSGRIVYTSPAPQEALSPYPAPPGYMIVPPAYGNNDPSAVPYYQPAPPAMGPYAANGQYPPDLITPQNVPFYPQLAPPVDPQPKTVPPVYSATLKDMPAPLDPNEEGLSDRERKRREMDVEHRRRIEEIAASPHDRRPIPDYNIFKRDSRLYYSKEPSRKFSPYAMGYGIEMMGDAFGPGMTSKVKGSGVIAYQADATFDGTFNSYGYRNYTLSNLRSPNGGSVGRTDIDINNAHTSFDWTAAANDSGKFNADGYPGGPKERFTVTESGKTVAGDFTGTTLQDLVELNVPYNVTLNADKSRIFGNVREVLPGEKILDPRVQWNEHFGENAVYLPEGTLITNDGGNVIAEAGEGYRQNSAILYFDYDIPETVFVRNVLGRVKISESQSVIPQTRFILDHNYFSLAPVTNGRANINRLTPGVEWAFLNNNRASFELRVPIGWTVNCEQALDDIGSEDTGTIGDITLNFKMLLKRTRRFAMSAGMAVSLPTSKDRGLSNTTEPVRNFLEVRNNSVHLMPFLGVMYLPNDAFYMQGFAQVDVSAGCSDVFFHDYVNTGTMQKFGTWNECTYAYLSGVVGRWLYKDFSKRYGINGINVQAELHYTQSLGKGKDIHGTFVSPDGLSAERVTITRRSTEEYLNLTFASHFLINRKNNLGFGFSVPIFDQKQFDIEARITWSRYF